MTENWSEKASCEKGYRCKITHQVVMVHDEARLAPRVSESFLSLPAEHAVLRQHNSSSTRLGVAIGIGGRQRWRIDGDELLDIVLPPDFLCFRLELGRVRCAVISLGF